MLDPAAMHWEVSPRRRPTDRRNRLGALRSNGAISGAMECIMALDSEGSTRSAFLACVAGSRSRSSIVGSSRDVVIRVAFSIDYAARALTIAP
jgi:hypothetical protein